MMFLYIVRRILQMIPTVLGVILITFILFKREKKVEDEGLEDEYDSEEEDRFAVLAQRRMAIEELAATWDTSFDAEEKEDHEEGQS